MSASEVLHFKTFYPNLPSLRPHRRFFAALCCMCLMSFGLGCKPSSSDTAPDSSKTSTSKATTSPKVAKTPPPKKDPSTQIVQSELFSVDLDMFDDAIRKQVIYAPTAAFKSGKWSISRDHLKSPALQARLVEMIVAQEIIGHEAKKRGLVLTPAEVNQYIKDNWRLARFEPQGVRMPEGALLPLPLSKLKITMDDVRDVAQKRLLRDRLRDKLLTEFTDEHFWLAWALDQSKVRALVVTLSNTPKSYELDSYVQRNAKKIEAHFKVNKARYQIPKMVQLTMLKTPPGKTTDKKWIALLSQARIALEKGEDARQVAGRLKLKLLTAQSLLRGEDKVAFRSKVGTIGVTSNAARGSYAWKVEQFNAPRSVELTPAKRREVASELMHSKSIVPSVRQRGVEAQKLLNMLKYKGSQATPASIAATTKALKQKGFQTYDTGFFTSTPEGFIPKIGLAESVVPALFKLTPTSPVLASPLLARQKVFMAAMIDRQYADKKQYEVSKDAFIKAYLEKQKPLLMQRFLGFRRQHYNVRTNLKPLRAKYGVIRKR